MSANKGTTSWDNVSDQNNQDNTQNTNQTQNQNNFGSVVGGLADLFSMTSMTSDSRNLKEVGEVQKIMKENFDQLKNSTTNEIQRKILPQIETLTSTISPTLPGLGMHVEIGNTLYVGCALFANSHLTINSERIHLNNNNNTSQLSVPVPPAQYITSFLVSKLKDHYTRFADGKGIKNVEIIVMQVVDLDMLDHSEAGDPTDRSRGIASFLAAAWEEAILVKHVQEAVKADAVLPSPFSKPDKPYGRDNCAEARVQAVSGRVGRDRSMSPANMEVITSTINNTNNYNPNGGYQDNSHEIARVTATVQLCGVTYQEHMQSMAANQNNRSAIEAFMGMGMGGNSVYANNYRPLRPVITINDVQSGEMMNFHGGLYPFFYGLYTLMTTNNNYVFAEALRKQSVGARGSLADLEVRIAQMMAGQSGISSPQRVVLDEKKMIDVELLNQWIRQNVSAHATFQVNLIPSGPQASVYNFLFRLAGKNNTDEVKTVVALLDSMTGKKFSKLVAENIASGKGWTPEKAILFPTQMLEVNGLATHGGKKLNTQELDEMMISNIKGKAGTAGIETYLGVKYGTNYSNEDIKQRSQRLRIELSQSLFDGAVHINGFAQPHIWNPEFMALLGTAMDGIGTLNVANNFGSYKSNAMVFAPGVGLQTYSAAGSNNANGAGIGAGFNMQGFFC